jgi:ATP-dependent DNA helicase PIF1
MEDSPIYEDYGAEFDEAVGVSDSEVPCEFITGSAGCGKTYMMRDRIATDPEFGILAATTGIAAVNLGTTTVNATLRYFDTASLRDSFLRGQLTTILHHLALEYQNLIIDEISMMDGQQLDYIYEATRQANGFKDVTRPMGIICVGDFAQLPPVKAKWAFDADCWPRFDSNTTRLTKMWRQDQPEFLMALNAARRGDGPEAARMLTEAGVEWQTQLEMEFDGTTIVPKNDAVDRYNWEALNKVKGNKITVRASRWGRQRGDWKLVGDTSDFKIGAYVMLLANRMEDGELIYANGDCGHVRGFEHNRFQVELIRNKEIVDVEPIVRSNEYKEKPDGWYGDESKSAMQYPDYFPKPHRNAKRRYVEGQLKYFPLRLAWASTVHRSQGLSLDRIQFDFRGHFAGAAAMTYVSLSRCRTLEGLRLVGMKEIFERRVKCDPRVARWL